MKASGKIGSSGVWVSDSVEKRFETDIHTYILVCEILLLEETETETETETTDNFQNSIYIYQILFFLCNF
jgi:hypothetical protein